MQICLVTAPTISDFEDPEVTLSAHPTRAPQLGVLCLAAAVRTHGHAPHLVDLDRIMIDSLSSARCNLSPDDVFERYIEGVLSVVDAPVYGFSSICGSYPATIRLAREVKARHPDAQIVFGGPQATVVDVATMQAFPWIDVVVRGEADETFPLLLDALQAGPSVQRMSGVAGITWRDGERVIQNPPAPLVASLDALPLPAFDLDRHIATRRSAHLELGRGCPYGCTFCSTNDFFRRKFRLKSSDVLLGQMMHLHDLYGVTAFTLVHDMYTVNRGKVVEFAELLIASGRKFEWSCSARTDRVDRELLDLMARSGCAGIFYGIESGSAALQKVIKKNLDLDGAWNAIRGATHNGMKTAVALIAGFPEETREDLRSTVHFFVQSRRLDNAEPQMSLLAPLAGTPIEKRYANELVFDHVYSDISAQGWREDPKDFELIRQHPRIFPNFYSVPALLPRAYVREIRDWTHGITFWFRWLPIALADATGDLLKVFDEFVRWHDQAPKDDVSDKYQVRTPRYYCSNVFACNLLAFVEAALADGRLPADPVLTSIFEYERALGQIERSDPQDISAAPPAEVRVSLNDRFARSRDVVIRTFPFNPAVLLGALRAGDKGAAAAAATTLAFVASGKEPIRVLGLSTRASDLVALCDGNATVSQVLQRFSSGCGEASSWKVGLAGLKRLYEDGILDVREAA